MAEGPPEDDDELERTHSQHTVAGIPFTSSAFEALNQRISEYTDDLVEESVRVARHQHSPDVVSASDVERAIEHLNIQARDRVARFVGTVGSILLGAAVGNVLQIIGASSVTPESAVLTFVCGVIGVAMTMFGFLRE